MNYLTDNNSIAFNGPNQTKKVTKMLDVRLKLMRGAVVTVVAVAMSTKVLSQCFRRSTKYLKPQ